MAVCPNRGKGIINFNLAPGDVILVCPYNDNHRFLKERLVKHLDKCRLAYQRECKLKGIPPKFRKCPYSDYHEFPEVEYESHMQTCIYKIDAVDPEPELELKPSVVKTEPEENFKSKDKSKKSKNQLEHEECWDEELERFPLPPYNPIDHCRRNRIAYLPSGLTHSEREKFRENLKKDYEQAGIESSVGGERSNANCIRPKIEPSSATKGFNEYYSVIDPSEVSGINASQPTAIQATVAKSKPSQGTSSVAGASSIDSASIRDFDEETYSEMGDEVYFSADD